MIVNEVAYVVGTDDLFQLDQTAYQHGHAGKKVIEDLIRQAINVIDVIRLVQGESEIRPRRKRPQHFERHLGDECDPVTQFLVVHQFLDAIPVIAAADNDQVEFPGIKESHGGYEFFDPALRIDAGALEQEQEFVARDAPFDLWRQRHGRPGVEQRYVADHAQFFSIIFVVEGSKGIADRIDMLQPGKNEVFDPLPEFFYEGPAIELRHAQPVFVRIVNDGLSTELARQPNRGQGVKIVGQEDVATGKEQAQEKPEVELGVEEGFFLGKHANASGGVGAGS